MFSMLMFCLIRLFPEYYQVIEKPMNLSVIKGKINSYESTEEFIADLQLIWSNCYSFNDHMAEVVQWAKDLSDAAENLIKVRM